MRYYSLFAAMISISMPCTLTAAEPEVQSIALVVQAHIDRKEVAGAVTLVLTPDRIVHHSAAGQADMASKIPMSLDSMFWIASMSKPVTACAIMMLQDEGRLSVDDPVSKYLPELAEMKTSEGKVCKLTLKHLLTHTSGLAEPKEQEALGSRTLAGLIPHFASKPLQFEPGARWQYSQSGINSLGRIIEVVSGKQLQDFLQERLFNPLGMKDTTFYPDVAQRSRLAKTYKLLDGKLEEARLPAIYDPARDGRYPAANGGLYSTARDYGRFCQMLLNRGTLGGKQYLTPAAVDAMSAVQSGDLKTGFTDGNGWGLGCCVVRQPQGVTAMLSPGTFGHGGAYGTQAWVDPVKKVAYVIMVQRANFPNSDDSELRSDFQNAAAVAAASAVVDVGKDIVIDGPGLKAVIGADAVWKSLVRKATGNELIAGSTKFAAGMFGETVSGHGAGTDSNVIDQQKIMAETASKRKTIQASRAAFCGNRLTIGFDGVDCELAYEVSPTAEGIVFKLVAVRGQRPRELELVRITVSPVLHVGPRLGAGWDDKVAVGLTAINLQTMVTAMKKDGATFVVASTQDVPGPHLEGAGVALVVGAPGEYRAALRRIASAYDLPRNEVDATPAKELPAARESYWFLSFGEADVDRVIDCCKQSGFRQVMLNSGSWCSLPGHYVFNTKMFPDGQDSLKRTVTRLHEAGIKVGMHCFASKIAKADEYVTPVPDKRFWVDRQTELASDLGPSNGDIRVTTDLREWPGSPVASQKMWEGGVEKHREVILDNEIVQFKSIGPEGIWDTFQDCRRGAFGTAAAGHKSGTLGRHYGVDGCINGYIIDQETDLLDEVTTRLGGIFNTCGFDMVYFDGGEDVDRNRFVYYVSKFQAESMKRFTKRPLIHMGTIMTHNLWHSFSRSGTVDTYLNTLYGYIQSGGSVDTWPTVRQHIDKSVDYMLSIGDDMMPGELGWFGIWPRGKHTDGLQLDEIEYLMTKSLAFNAPISLQTSFGQMAKHPLTPGILEVVKVYEDGRLNGSIAASTVPELREKGVDYCILREGDAWRFVKLDSPFKVDDIKISVGGYKDGAIAVVWGSETVKNLVLPASLDSMTVSYIRGEKVDVAGSGAESEIKMGPRRVTILAPKTTPGDMKILLIKARVSEVQVK